MLPLLVDLETVWRGGQNQALLLLKGLRARGHAAELVTAKDSALGERAAANGVPVHFVSRGWLRSPAASKILQLVKSGRFDLVHANEAHAVTAAWLAGAHRRTAFLISRRVGYPLGKSRLTQARYHAAHCIIANSEWVAEQASATGAERDKVEVVYEGAEIPPLPSVELRKQARLRWGVEEGTPLLGCVGVLLPDKGQEWLIRALAALRPEFPACQLLLAGDGPLRPQLEALGSELGVSDAVLFPGFVKDVENVYAALDVFLLPSFFEALNNSLLAAMTYEIPCIAFNRGALGEIIEQEKSGLLVSGPNVEEIRDAAARYLRDRDFARSIGRHARRRVQEKFSAERMVGGTIAVYEQAIRQYLWRRKKEGES